MVEHLLAHPDVLVVYPDWLLTDGDGKVVRRVATYDYDYLNMLRWHFCLPGPGAFFRRTLVERLGGRDPNFRYVNDFDFWLRAGLLGPFARVPATLATFRYHPAARSYSDLGQVMAEEYVRLINKFYGNADLPPEVLKVKREARSSAYFAAGSVCGENVPQAVIRRYFLRALWYAPHKYLREYRVRLFVMLPVLLGRLYEPLRRVISPLYRGLRAAHKRLASP
jgi:GT2 family glycosyltransferase